jgi:putative OmpL-like beta-barrel porin-2
MSLRIRSLLLAAVSALALGATSRAAETQLNPIQDPGMGVDPLVLHPVYAADEMDMNMNVGTMQRAPLMSLLDKAGLAKPLDQAGIDIYGFIELSYTYNTFDPHPTEPNGLHRIQLRMFDHHSDTLAMNRFDLYIERFVNYHKNKFDVGGLVELQYGTDAAMMHSNGTMDYDYGGYFDHSHPDYQFDPTQFYVDVAIPIGSGLRLRGGKFATLFGYESCDPVHNQAVQFYSRSYILTFGIPMYQTGAYATYDIFPALSLNAGFSRGWEQGFSDNNGAIDFFATANWQVNDKIAAMFGVSEGPELPNDNSHYRTLLEGILYFTPDPKGPWAFAMDAIVGWEDNQVTQYFKSKEPNRTPQLETVTFPAAGNTSWYGVALFGAYSVTDTVKLKARAEWFHDSGGTRFRFPAANASYTAGPMSDSFVSVGTTYNVFELTFGADLIPFPRDARTLVVRPEIRGDFASHNIFVNGNRMCQVTLGVDVIYRF